MKVKIDLDAVGIGKVLVDGVELRHVERVRISAGVDEFPRVSLTFIAAEIEFDAAEAEVFKILRVDGPVDPAK